ncbi:MAG: hypothetical protein L3J14_02140 [Flavobacteriaceae bacterium]|nr:hypothetical protein [Flavobacteriaceae bacterium]
MTQEKFKNIAPKLYELQQLKSGFSIPTNYFGTLEDAVFLKLSDEKLDKENPFKTPDNYFLTIEDRVFDNIKSEEKETAFSIPKGYFDTVEDNVFKKLHTETKVIDFKTRFTKTFLPIAAAASLLLFVTLQLLNSNNDNTDLFASMEISEIESWIEDGSLELDSYEITTVYQDVDFEDLELNQQYSDDNLVEYLEDIDIQSLILTN